MNEQLHPWAIKQWEQSGQKTVGIYAGALGFTYNTELLVKKKLPEPKCWADLAKPEFRDEVQMSNPTSSGTAYTALATLIQLWGEEKAFDYLDAPPLRVTAEDVPLPYAANLEKLALPKPEHVIKAAKAVLYR